MAELDASSVALVAAMSEVMPERLGRMRISDARSLANAAPPGPVQPVERVEECSLTMTDTNAGTNVVVRIYDNHPERHSKPVLQYMHGGGWTIGGLNSCDAQCRAVANAIDVVVVSVDYPLAPEHPFPAAPEACFGVYRWLVRQANEIGGRADRIAIGGDSAGANLAAALCLMARDAQIRQPCLQWLIYPATRFCDPLLPSMVENHDAPMLSADDVTIFFRHYAADPTDALNRYLAPANAHSHADLAPALLQVADCDPLRDDGLAYADMLRRANTEVTATNYGGVPHGFMAWLGVHEHADRAVREGVEHLSKAFAAVVDGHS